MENIHYFFYIICTKIHFLNKFKRKSFKKQFYWSKNLYTSQASNSTREVLPGCSSDATRTVPAAFSLRRVSHLIFLLASF